MNPCPLCLSKRTQPLLQRQKPPHYHLCLTCDLRFLQSDQRLDATTEEARYREHNNQIEDPAYRGFLNPLRLEMLKRIQPQSRGLDFGAGPGPALAEMLKEDGHSMNVYDPVFWPDKDALAGKYDFVVTTEVVEHLFDPAQEFMRLASLLKPDGWLGVMTLLYRPDIDFAEWYYPRDPTHVVFYSMQTFQWIARQYGFTEPVFVGDRIIILQKN